MQYTGIPILKHFGAFRQDQIEATSSASYAQVRYNDGVGPGTVWTELGHLSTVLNWALKRGFISYKPYIKCPAKPAPSEKFFTRPEIERLLSAPDTPHHIQLAMLLMLGTAGRQEAILELTWDRIDFHRGQIDLRRPAAYTRKGRAVVPMSEGLQSALTFAQTAAVSEYVIEWAGRVAEWLPEPRIEVRLEHRGPSTRGLTLAVVGASEALEALLAALECPRGMEEWVDQKDPSH